MGMQLLAAGATLVDRMSEDTFFGLENIFFRFNIGKQNGSKADRKDGKSIENSVLPKNAPKNEPVFSEIGKKFNKSNFLFDNTCISEQTRYNK